MYLLPRTWMGMHYSLRVHVRHQPLCHSHFLPTMLNSGGADADQSVAVVLFSNVPVDEVSRAYS